MKIEMQNICKSFGSNLVLDDVSFSVQGGEICALLGENGAGKSTLMNILGGVHQADSGRICIDGKEVKFLSPIDSLSEGIAFIHQELNLINDLPIYENMFIGHELKTKHGFVDHAEMIKKTEEIFNQIHINLNPRELVRNLDASYKQIVEISRAIMMKASIIIMDEPTTSLTEPEIERVFELMKQLQAQNVGMIFISHKLGEVLFVCTRYTVLRDGHLIQSGNTKETTSSDLAYYMVGHKVSTEAVSRNMNAGEEMLKVEHYGDGKHFHDISLSVKKSEILGITGLLGDGRSELFLSLFGAKSAETGSVYLNGEKVSFQSTQDAVKHGFAYVPRNRKENGILKDMSILENGTLVTLPDYKKGILIDSKMQKETFHKQVCKIHIKMGDDSDLITSLSGGNQQKVILTRWLNAQPKVLVMDNPTQGVDIGAKEEIYAVIRQIAEEGVAVVILSSEAQEIMQVCDRALVMFHGKIMGEVSGNTMNEHTIMRLATGECINEV